MLARLLFHLFTISVITMTTPRLKNKALTVSIPNGDGSTDEHEIITAEVTTDVAGNTIIRIDIISPEILGGTVWQEHSEYSKYGHATVIVPILNKKSE